MQDRLYWLLNDEYEKIKDKVILIIGLEWCIFVGLYSAVELFNKIFKNK